MTLPMAAQDISSHVMIADMPKPKRDAASVAVTALREHMGLTQQRFAVEVLDSAITTIARYETSFPPRGETLLRLASIAERQRRPDIADTFVKVFMADVRKYAPRAAVDRWVSANA